MSGLNPRRTKLGVRENLSGKMGKHWEQCSANAKCKMSMGNHRPPLSEKGSIVSLNGDHNENCARNVNSRGHSEMCAEMC